MSWALDNCEKAGCDQAGASRTILHAFGLQLCAKHLYDFDHWVVDRHEYKRLGEQIAQWTALCVAYRGTGDHGADVLKVAAAMKREASDIFSRMCMAWLDTPDKAEAAE